MTEEAKGTRYLVLKKYASGGYIIHGTATKSGPVVAAKEVDSGDGGAYLVVAESAAHFVTLEEFTPPSSLRASTPTLDEILGQTTIEEALGAEVDGEFATKIEDEAAA